MKRTIQFIKTTYLWVIAVPYLTIALGIGLNQAVMIANHDKFPVMYNEVQAAQFVQSDGTIDDYHCVMTKDTHLNALADIFTLEENVYSSIGDTLIDAGYWVNSYVVFGWILYLLAITGLEKRKNESIQEGT